MLNMDMDVLPDTFVQNHLEDIQAIAEGDAEALKNLRADIGSEPVVLEILAEAHVDEAEVDINELMQYVNFAQNALPDLEVGAKLEDEAFLSGLTALVTSSDSAAKAIMAIFDGLGYDVHVSTQTVHYPSLVASGGFSISNVAGTVQNALDAASFAQEAHGEISISEGGGVDVAFPVVDVVAKGSNSGGASYTPSGSGSGGGRGGGGSKAKEPSKASRTKAADSEKDIYNKLNAQLEKLQDNYKRINRLREDAAGSKYRKYINEEIANLEAQNANLAKRNKLTKEYLKALKGNADNPNLNVKKTDTLGLYGLKDKDNNGVVGNYDSIIDTARKKAAAAQQAADDYFKAHGGAFDAYGNTTTEATMNEDESEQYKKLTEAAANQAERVNLITDATNKYQDA